MDTERIERVLREGPPDEPIYVPGAFRVASPTGWWLAVAAVAVVVALGAGIASGVGLGLLRNDTGDAPEPRVLASGELQGIWQADPIDFDAWTNALLDRGFAQADIDAFLQHDPFEEQLRYQLRFEGERLIIQVTYDDLPLETLGEGVFTIGADGTLDYFEVVDGVQGSCGVIATLAVDGDELTFDVLNLPGCETDEQLANTLFFDVPPYRRVDE